MIGTEQIGTNGMRREFLACVSLASGLSLGDLPDQPVVDPTSLPDGDLLNSYEQAARRGRAEGTSEDGGVDLTLSDVYGDVMNSVDVDLSDEWIGPTSQKQSNQRRE
jgi:hypothetical protein